MSTQPANRGERTNSGQDDNMEQPHIEIATRIMKQYSDSAFANGGDLLPGVRMDLRSLYEFIKAIVFCSSTIHGPLGPLNYDIWLACFGGHPTVRVIPDTEPRIDVEPKRDEFLETLRRKVYDYLRDKERLEGLDLSDTRRFILGLPKRVLWEWEDDKKPYVLLEDDNMRDKRFVTDRVALCYDLKIYLEIFSAVMHLGRYEVDQNNPSKKKVTCRPGEGVRWEHFLAGI